MHDDFATVFKQKIVYYSALDISNSNSDQDYNAPSYLIFFIRLPIPCTTCMREYGVREQLVWKAAAHMDNSVEAENLNLGQRVGAYQWCSLSHGTRMAREALAFHNAKY